MTPTIPMEEMAAMYADFQARQRQAKMADGAPEPVDANIIPNPNLGKRLEYPRAVHNHKLMQSQVVHSKEEHERLGSDWTTQPLPERAQAAVVKSAGMDEAVDTERLDSLENRVLSLEQGIAELNQGMAEVLKRLKK